jgi:hypothetical protein
VHETWPRLGTPGLIVFMNTGHTGGRNTLGELCTYLEAVRQTGGFQSLALADTDGLLIAGAGKFSECEELSALSAERSLGAPRGGSILAVGQRGPHLCA